MNKKELIKSLNKLLADEWLSYYRYWIGAKVMEGDIKETVAPELEEMAVDELQHACMLVSQIMKLGGMPILNPTECEKISDCRYEAPKDCTVKSILFQNIKSEQCSIDVYKKLVNLTKHKDTALNEVLLNILEEEVEQKDDLLNIMEHLEGKSLK